MGRRQIDEPPIDLGRYEEIDGRKIVSLLVAKPIGGRRINSGPCFRIALKSWTKRGSRALLAAPGGESAPPARSSIAGRRPVLMDCDRQSRMPPLPAA